MAETGEAADAPPAEGDLPSVEEITNSLTGFDELAVESLFRRDLQSLSATMLVRALVFVMERRGGVADRDAFRAAMQAPFGSLMDRFRDSPDDDAEGAALLEAVEGKDDDAGG